MVFASGLISPARLPGATTMSLWLKSVDRRASWVLADYSPKTPRSLNRCGIEIKIPP